MHILVVDDDASRADLLAAAAARGCPGAHIHIAPPAAAADPATEQSPAGLVMLGPGTIDRPGALDVVRAARARRPTVPLLVVSAQDGAAHAVAAMKAGATDYVVLDGDADEVADAVACLLRAAPIGGRRPPRAATAAGEPLGGLIGRSGAMDEVRALIRMAASTEAQVLIEGETGTGKELVARAIHALGRRAAGPFVPVNCAAVPETLAEAEFFGHTRGAFTGALQERPGMLQLADRGTLFLDEVEDLPAPLQAKLLRAVQDHEVKPLGATALRRVDVRIVAASNRDLWGMVEAGEFRRDLYYRLRVITIRLPPLRLRREDLPQLVEHFVARFNRAHGTTFAPPSPTALRSLTAHTWPGNVRELENALEALLVFAGATGAGLDDVLSRQTAAPTGLVLDERTRILHVLEAHRWNRQRAAAALGISRVTLWRRMERHGIRDPLGSPLCETA
ncbi:MAG: sigma-54-dependent Fis family transcriptional regulator [Deltaproteobacteria bacterium]|nr:MAG: sigma-54-dependent Fis family transcriptional regulator [Deltaproteobacteria bacterium]